MNAQQARQGPTITKRDLFSFSVPGLFPAGSPYGKLSGVLQMMIVPGELRDETSQKDRQFLAGTVFAL
jgi:hypothetical protein